PRRPPAPRPASGRSPRWRPWPPGRRRSPRIPGSRPAGRRHPGTTSSCASRWPTAPPASPATPQRGGGGAGAPRVRGPPVRADLEQEADPLCHRSPRLGGPGDAAGGSRVPEAAPLEVELGDVVLVEDLRRAEQHLAVLADVVVSQLSGLE